MSSGATWSSGLITLAIFGVVLVFAAGVLFGGMIAKMPDGSTPEIMRRHVLPENVTSRFEVVESIKILEVPLFVVRDVKTGREFFGFYRGAFTEIKPKE